MRQILIAAMSLLVLIVGGANAGIRDGLVAYYPLDGNSNDAAGDNHGTFMGTDTTANYTAGKFGQGIDLDGVDQFIELANESNFDFVGQDFSIAAWFRVDAFTKNWQALIAKGEGNRWRVHRRGGESIFTWNGGNADVPAGTNPPIDDGELHHFAGVSTNGVDVKMYIDGVLVATGPAPAVQNNDMPAMIGENPDARGRTFDGLIDDVGIWGRALTQGEITFLQSHPIGVPEPSSGILAILGVLGMLRLRKKRS